MVGRRYGKLTHILHYDALELLCLVSGKFEGSWGEIEGFEVI